jgi:4-hydroxybenzoate polyprenyltransferase
MISLLRPSHWSKNALVVTAPLVMDPGAIAHRTIPLLATLVAFTAAASSVYVVNDWLDRERDRLHPEKRHRPIASGRISLACASLLGGGCLAVLAACLLLMPWDSRLLIGAYLALNVCYCLWLKHQSLIDVSAVAFGFVLRVAAGSAAVNLPISSQLLTCVYTSCLLLSLGKRRHELSRKMRTSVEHRPALRHYSTGLLDSLMVVMLAITLMIYFMFIQGDLHSRHPLLAAVTMFFAILAGTRYLQLVIVREIGGEPSRDLARDYVTLLNGALWLGVLISAST